MRQAWWAWGVALFVLAGISIAQTQPSDWTSAILTPKAGPEPRINGPKSFGVRPGSPFLFTIPATGDRPMQFSADGLPEGLALDASTGRISGATKAAGEHLVTLHASNAAGKTDLAFKIVVGDTLALTPPMGWNSWYCYMAGVTDAQMRQAADAIASSGLINHGYSYVNIDDGWSIMPASKDPKLTGEERDADGKVNANAKFPDMKAMTDYIHDKGLKAGIYSSPGPLTCARFVGSYQHEAQDAARYAEWGFDFLKYDWCSYGKIVPKPTPEQLREPYIKMSDLLKKQPRDFVYNLCQYGRGDVATWGRDVGGHCWRTAGDLGAHKSLYEGLTKDGFLLASKVQWSRPGGWNDPDYLQVGMLWRGGKLVPCPLTPDEQYTHMSLWCLLSAPLFIGGEVQSLDPFTTALLSNDEVIEVDQDSIGKSLGRIAESGTTQVWAKEMDDKSLAVGLFNIGDKEASVKVTWGDLKINGSRRVRDLWRQKDLGNFNDHFEATVPTHGVVMVRVFNKE